MVEPGVLAPYSSLLHTLYRASHERTADEFHEAVLALIKGVLPFDSSMWGAGAHRDGAVQVHSLHLHEQPMEMIENWQRHNHEDTIVTEVTTKLGVAFNAHSPVLFSGARKRGMREHADRYGVQNALVICTPQPGGLLHWISLFRGDADAHFSAGQKQLLEALWPHIVEALTINRRLTLNALYPARASSALAVVDRLGFVHHLEDRFKAVLCEEWSQWDGAVLPQELIPYMERVPAEYAGRRITMEFRKAADLFFVKARERSAIDELSRRERLVALAFSRGRSAKEIARAHSVSPETVRKQIFTAYRKLGVRDKASLATLLAGHEVEIAA